MTSLAYKNARLTWTDECGSTFQELKHRLTSAPFLTIPDGTTRFMLSTDASSTGLDCVLMQHEKVTAYVQDN